jgi:hypothetical protein
MRKNRARAKTLSNTSLYLKLLICLWSRSRSHPRVTCSRYPICYSIEHGDGAGGLDNVDAGAALFERDELGVPRGKFTSCCSGCECCYAWENTGRTELLQLGGRARFLSPPQPWCSPSFRSACDDDFRLLAQRRTSASSRASAPPTFASQFRHFDFRRIILRCRDRHCQTFGVSAALAASRTHAAVRSCTRIKQAISWAPRPRARSGPTHPSQRGGRSSA